MHHFNRSEIDQLARFDRARFINSLSGFKSANLIGTIDENGQENLCIVSSVFHLGANPPLLGMIVRPHSVPRHTLENLLETQSYTINHVHSEIIEAAHQTSANYAKGTSEFSVTGLSPQYLDDCPAPFVMQSRLKMALQYREHQPLAINDTVLVIGEITDVYLPEKALRSDFSVNIEACQSVAISGLDQYHSTTTLTRLSYAKPDRDLTTLEF